MCKTTSYRHSITTNTMWALSESEINFAYGNLLPRVYYRSLLLVLEKITALTFGIGNYDEIHF